MDICVEEPIATPKAMSCLNSEELKHKRPALHSLCTFSLTLRSNINGVHDLGDVWINCEANNQFRNI